MTSSPPHPCQLPPSQATAGPKKRSRAPPSEAQPLAREARATEQQRRRQAKELAAQERARQRERRQAQRAAEVELRAAQRAYQQEAGLMSRVQQGELWMFQVQVCLAAGVGSHQVPLIRQHDVHQVTDCASVRLHQTWQAAAEQSPYMMHQWPSARPTAPCMPDPSPCCCSDKLLIWTAGGAVPQLQRLALLRQAAHKPQQHARLWRPGPGAGHQPAASAPGSVTLQEPGVQEA